METKNLNNFINISLIIVLIISINTNFIFYNYKLSRISKSLLYLLKIS